MHEINHLLINNETCAEHHSQDNGIQLAIKKYILGKKSIR